jgi:hypothetical protein
MPVPIPIPRHEPVDDSDKTVTLAIMLRRNVGSGERHGYAFRLAALGVDVGVEEETLFDLVSNWNNERCTPPIKDRAVRHAINCALRRKMWA